MSHWQVEVGLRLRLLLANWCPGRTAYVLRTRAMRGSWLDCSSRSTSLQRAFGTADVCARLGPKGNAPGAGQRQQSFVLLKFALYESSVQSTRFILHDFARNGQKVTSVTSAHQYTYVHTY